MVNSGDRRDEAAVLRVRDLRVTFQTPHGRVHAVNGLDLDVYEAETVAVVGESGSGKSVTFRAIMGLLESPPAEITSSAVEFRGRDIRDLSPRQWRDLRGSRISMIFQDALTALNPVFTVGYQIEEMLRVHQGVSRREARHGAIELMGQVGIPRPERRVDQYPHEFSGGMQQRVMIAIALALEPDVVIADEPTTALDVTIQKQILELLADLRAQMGMSVVLITHDLGVVAEVADRAAVMYAGEVAEALPVSALRSGPAHPYTQGLIGSLPQAAHGASRLNPIPGAPPDMRNIPSGCPFHPRCAYVQARCRSEKPPLHTVASFRASACHFYDEVLRDSRRDEPRTYS